MLLADAAYLTVQLLESAPVLFLALALPSVRLEAEKVPPLFAKLTVPVGAVATTGVASVTVAVQLVGLPTEIGRASRRARVAVACLVAGTAAGGLGEAAGAASSGYW